MFLTRVPTGIRDTQPTEISGSTAYFSLVGFLLGLVGLIPFFFLPPTYAVLLSLALVTILTGALHEDGLADVCDGLFGAYEPKKRLKIMADSQIGTFGGIGLWFLFTVKFFLLRDIATTAQLAEEASWFPWILATPLMFSRASSVVLLVVAGNSRPEIGEENSEAKVSKFFSQVGPKEVFICILIAMLAGIWLMQAKVWICVASAVVTAGLAGWYFKRRLGTLNGDALGAVTMLVEVACLAALLCHVAGTSVPNSS